MIRLENIGKTYGASRVVEGISLEVNDAEFVVLLGSSGSGKSTLLRMVAGLIMPDEGSILLHGADITRLPPQQRGFGFVFQNYSIFPYMTVAENIGFGLKIRQIPPAERRRRTELLLEMVGLAGLGIRYANQLSGGQLQRVALARALAYDPKVLLLDEPFGAVDAKTRIQLRKSLKEIVREMGVTTLMVTHDQEEAFELADRIAVINRGRIEQCALSSEVYYTPATRFTADFVGDINFMEGKVSASGPNLCEIELAVGSRVRRRGAYPFAPGRQVIYGIRPEQIRVSLLEPQAHENGIQGVIEKRLFLGDATQYAIRLEGERLLEVKILNYLFIEGMVMPYELNERVWLIWSQGSGIILDNGLCTEPG
jgi:ABC-type Fe3+/spermidine/putrescine transport system ATPase subunit